MTKRLTSFTLLEVLIYSSCTMMMVPLLHAALRVVAQSYRHICHEHRLVFYHYPTLQYILDDVAQVRSYHQKNDQLVLVGLGWQVAYQSRADGVYRRRKRVVDGRQVVWSAYCAPPIKKITATRVGSLHVLISYYLNDTTVWYRVARCGQE